MPSIFRSHSFYIKVVTTFVGLLLLTVIPIVSYNYYKNTHMALGLSDDLMAQYTRTVMEKTSNYFLPAGALVEISARLAELGALTITNYKQVELFTLGTLKSYPQISLFYFGDEKGNYIRAMRLPNGTIEGRIIHRDVSPATNTMKYWDSDFKLLKTDTSTLSDYARRKGPYEHRERPWYKGAKETRASYWTDSYLIAVANQAPVVTAAYPVLDQTGKLVGVWAVDLDLAEISTFLSSLKIGKSGLALILNAKNEVVAFPDLSRLVKEEKGELRSVVVDELGIDHLSQAFQEYLRSGRGKFTITSHGQRYLASFAKFPPSFPARWKVGLVIPEDDFIGGAKNLIRASLLICLVILSVAILIASLISRSISTPIKLLAEETKRIKDFHLEEEVQITTHIKEIQLMKQAIAAMKSGLKAFRRYVPAELVRQLIHTGEEARLGGDKRELTVFFSDIAGFTTIAERLAPEELMVHLSAYFDDLTRILSESKGTVDKYIGDSIMAFWGAPIPDPDHAFHACHAALLCQERLQELNHRWKQEGKAPLATRMGISTGETVVGNVGSSERINYTVMGDNVNLASRLEGVNKLYGTRIIVNRATYEAVQERFHLRPLDLVAVKGKSQGSMIYELRGRKGEGDGDDAARLCAGFSRGFEAYLAQDWDGALQIFEELSRQFPGDGPTGQYLSRCRDYRDHPPGPDWQGIRYLEVK
jgi:adenylate cyclase